MTCNKTVFLIFTILTMFVSACASQTQASEPTTSATDSLRIAITFDDLPAHSSLPPGETRMGVATKIIEALHKAGVPPTYGFTNGALIEQQPADAAVLTAWLEAGNVLGNHTFSHLNFNQHSLEEFNADVMKNEPLLKKCMGKGDWQWFRFPYLAQGDTPEKQAGARKFLLERGYRLAGTTMSFADYLYNEPYARCSAKGDSKAIAVLEDTYLAAADESIAFNTKLSHTLFGRNIPFVLLMHIGAFDARMLPRLLELYKSRGVQFVTLEEAEADEFYKIDTDLRLAAGPDNLEGTSWQRNIPVPPHAMAEPQFEALCR